MSIEFRKHRRIERVQDFIDSRFFEPRTRWRALFIAIAFIAGLLGGGLIVVVVKALALAMGASP